MAIRDAGPFSSPSFGSLQLPSRVDRRISRGLVGSFAFVLLWTALARQVPTYLLPTPLAVGQAFVVEATTPATYALPVLGTELTLTSLAVVLLQSLTHYLPGLFLGVGVGVPLGVALAWWETIDQYVSPVVGLLRPIPPLAWMGLVIVWVGIGHAGAAVIVAIGSLWITFFAAYGGVRELPPKLLEAGRSLGVDTDREMLRAIVLPGAAAPILTGVRTSIGRSWMIVVAAELFGAPGIGYRIIHTAQSLAMDVSMAYMLALGLAYLLSDAAFGSLRRRVTPW
ncbi:ABC-type nitrate/sulfonate/bicarbonate transportsystem, permease component [Halanaeroarchaeum sp. HSR-CO]|uniref:ABC transporter permease n=1 Tax=Halanaeroarchaeum sp. HSR-CO TaxID=2866382 RepID=UPI00217DC136|nr:ABC transporter permease subunit [Halanaeroarchaeum sp. HSR-CO]UWG46416.1 ABC-type nitrate/sulfonate/bicarbonate transportsystem, permease component [Halanaeroarchaeum sp. HSR-CO]